MSVCIRQERAGTGKAAGVEDAGQWRSPKAVKKLTFSSPAVSEKVNEASLIEVVWSP